MEDPSSWRLTTSGGIPYRVVERGGSFSYDEAGASEQYIIRASDLLAFVMDAFPEPFVLMGTLFYPQQPVIPGLGTLVPKRIGWKQFVDGLPVDPFGADWAAPTGTYQDYVVVTVEYGGSPTNDQEPDSSDPFTFLEVSANASGVFLNSPLEGKATWVVPSWNATQSVEDALTNEITVSEKENDEVQEPNVPHTVTETQVDWSVRWPSIPFTFWNGTMMGRLRSKLGKVNSLAMPLLHGAPPETILFLGYSASTSFTWRQGKAGKNPVNLEMHFLEKNFVAEETVTTAIGWHDHGDGPVYGEQQETHEVQVTHQHVWRPNFGWRKLMIDGSYLYSTTDLNKIWEPE